MRTSMFWIESRLCWLWSVVLVGLLASGGRADAALEVPPMRVLWLTDRGFHDYTPLAPGLAARLGEMTGANVVINTNRAVMTNSQFAEGYDVVVYDLCFDDTDAPALKNALGLIRAGKPAVLLHCSVHALRRFDHTPEECCGAPPGEPIHYPALAVERTGEASPILRGFPKQWTTPGGEMDRRIEIVAGAHALLIAPHPRDGNLQVVCWSQDYGRGRIFGLSLGHDPVTVAAPEFRRLLANGLLWATRRLADETNSR